MLVEGGSRARIQSYGDNPEFFEAWVQPLPELDAESEQIEAMSRTVITQFEQYVKLNKKIHRKSSSP